MANQLEPLWAVAQTRIDPESLAQETPIVTVPDGIEVACVYWDTPADADRARRWVAAHNATVELSTEALENGVVAQLVNGSRAALSALSKYESVESDDETAVELLTTALRAVKFGK